MEYKIVNFGKKNKQVIILIILKFLNELNLIKGYEYNFSQ